MSLTVLIHWYSTDIPVSLLHLVDGIIEMITEDTLSPLLLFKRPKESLLWEKFGGIIKVICIITQGFRNMTG